MAFQILDYIGDFIKANNSYFDSFRVNGIQLPGGEVIEFTNGSEKQFIGIGDNFGTSGYIRFDPSITHTQNDRRISSVSSGAYIKKCRLVAYSWDNKFTSEKLMSKLVGDLKIIPFTGAKRKPQIIIRKSNYNYTDIFKEEFKKEISQAGQEFTSISIDFDIQYWEGECTICDPSDPNSQYVLIIDQHGNIIARKLPPQTYSVLVFSGIKDTGPPYTNSIVDNG